MDIILGQLWNVFVSLLLLSIVFVGLTTMVGKGKWGLNKVLNAWKWVCWLGPIKLIKAIGKGLWRLFFPKKKSGGGGGRRRATT